VVRVADIGAVLSERTVLIAGAACATGCALTAILARHGATVIALDRDMTPLLPTAIAFPEQVELLKLDMRDTRHAQVIGAIWADEQLHGFVSLLALAAADDLLLSCRMPVALASAFAPGLRAGQGTALLVWPERGHGPADAAYRAGADALIDALDREPWAPPGGVHMAELTGPADVDSIAAILALLMRPLAARVRGGRFRLVHAG
jgi:hypothetical protein